MRLLFLMCLSFSPLCTGARARGASEKQITRAEIIHAILTNSEECDREDQIDIWHLEYFDFLGNGQQQAVVDASTCLTGTAGPDIHAVYARNTAGRVVELPFQRVEGQEFFSYKKWNLPVFGNPNYSLSVEKGALVARWLDSSDRAHPLTIWYKWNGKEFVINSRTQEGPFKTSYDCSKARKEIEQAICYSPAVAALDVELAAVYSSRLRQVSDPQKSSFKEQQRTWLAEREKKCTIYKWWVECLTDLYTRRIGQLRDDHTN